MSNRRLNAQHIKASGGDGGDVRVARRSRFAAALLAPALSLALVVTGLTPALADEDSVGGGTGGTGGTGDGTVATQPTETPAPTQTPTPTPTPTDPPVPTQDPGPTNPPATENPQTETRSMRVGPQADPIPADYYLSLNKTAAGAEGSDISKLQPGQPFTYTLRVTCSQIVCTNVSLEDQLPQELQGFKIEALVNLFPGSEEQWLVDNVPYTEGDPPVPAMPKEVNANTKLVITKDSMATATTGTILLTLRVPDDFSPQDPRNGSPIANMASVEGDSANRVESTARVTPNAKKELKATASKSWGPENELYDPGAESTITLGGSAQGSNVDVDTLTITEPSGAKAGATALGANNPFRVTDFAGFDQSAIDNPSATFPQGADRVKVDAYVQGPDGKWGWVESPDAAAAYQLPTGVTPDQVGGLRFTYSSSTGEKIPKDAPANAIPFKVTQRAKDRNNDKELTNTTSRITNTIETQTTDGPDKSPVEKANAPHTITPNQINTTASKSMSPGAVAPGSVIQATIGGQNTQNAVSKLVITETGDFFDDTAKFGGFNGPITFPEGANKGYVQYFIEGSANPRTVTFTSGATPGLKTDDGEDVDPSKVTGFNVVFESNDGSGTPVDLILQNANSSIPFAIKTTDEFKTDSEPFEKTNTSTSTVYDHVGTTKTSTATDTVKSGKPKITSETKKDVGPKNNIVPGDVVVATLTNNTTGEVEVPKEGGTETIKTDLVRQIVIEDSLGLGSGESWDPGDDLDFWNAFKLSSVESTPVPANTELVFAVKVQGGGYQDIVRIPATDTGSTFKMTGAQIQAELDKLQPAIQLADVTGVQFRYTRPDNQPAFSSTEAISPHVGFTALEDRRDGQGKTDTTPEGQQTVYTNTTCSDAAFDSQTADKSCAPADAGIIIDPEKGPEGIDKEWDKDTLDTLRHDTAGTYLYWRVKPGRDTAVIMDSVQGFETDGMGVAAPVGDSVFDAFNLTGIDPIASTAKYDNGWYLKWDTISEVQLWDGGSQAWVTVPAPDGKWQNDDGSFKGYTLNPDQQKSTLAVRIVLKENNEARLANEDPDNPDYDPSAPKAGTGVASGDGAMDATAGHDGDRFFRLQWQLRNKKRSDDKWVTEKAGYNVAAPDLNVVRNDAEMWTPKGHDTTNDRIRLIDPQIFVQSVKSWTPDKTANVTGSGQLVISGYEDADNKYPTGRFRVQVRNTAGKTAGEDGTHSTTVTHAKLTEPSIGDSTDCDTASPQPCPPADPYANPFNPKGLEGQDLQNHLASLYTPANNPFNRMDITGLDFWTQDNNSKNANHANQDPRPYDPANQATWVNWEQSTVYLLRYSDTGVYSIEKTNAKAAQGLDAEDLKDVIAVSAAFNGLGDEGGRIWPSSGTGRNTIILDIKTKARVNLRFLNQPAPWNVTDSAWSPTTKELVESPNTVEGRAYSTITNPPVTPTSNKTVTINYTTGALDVTTSKTIDKVTTGFDDDPSKDEKGVHTVQQLQRANTVLRATLTADQGASLEGPDVVFLTDAPDNTQTDPAGEPICRPMKANPSDPDEPDPASPEDRGECSDSFWRAFELVGFDPITVPSPQWPVDADGVTLEVWNGTLWITGDRQEPSAGRVELALPNGVNATDVRGFRLKWDRADGKQMAKNWNGGVSYRFKMRADNTQVPPDDPTYFDPIDSDNKFQGSTTNAVRALSTNKVRNAAASGRDIADWNPGDPRLAINKVANSSTWNQKTDGRANKLVGELVPWVISLKNVGTGEMHLKNVEDTLSEFLSYTGYGDTNEDLAPDERVPGVEVELDETVTPAFEDVHPKVSVDSTGKKLTITFTGKDPQGVDVSRLLLPGETLKIRVWTQLELGAADESTRIVNTAKAETDEPLGAPPTNLVPDNGGTVDTQGNASDYVQLPKGPNMAESKSVAGHLPGAVSMADGSECAPSYKVGGKDFYRPPCVANSTIGGRDQWMIVMANAGTTALNQVMAFDALPDVGDTMLIGNAPRDSLYRPQLTKLPTVQLIGADGRPKGFDPKAVLKLEVTTTANACRGTWSRLSAKPDNQDPVALFADTEACNQVGASWTAVNLDGTGTQPDWSKVRGMRLVVDLGERGDGSNVGLQAGESVRFMYETVNTPVKAESVDKGASINVTASSDDPNTIRDLAINQVGGAYWANNRKDVGGKRIAGDQGDVLAGSKVGVHLQTGTVRAMKGVEGPAFALEAAPDTVTMDVACVAPNDLGGSPTDTTKVTFDGDASKTVTLTKQVDPSDPSKIKYVGTDVDPTDPDGKKLLEGQMVSGIPVNAQCTITETGNTGDFNEDKREPDKAGGKVTVVNKDTYDSYQPDKAAKPVTYGDIADQTVTWKNTYSTWKIKLTKGDIADDAARLAGAEVYLIGLDSAGNRQWVYGPDGGKTRELYLDPVTHPDAAWKSLFLTSAAPDGSFGEFDLTKGTRFEIVEKTPPTGYQMPADVSLGKFRIDPTSGKLEVDSTGDVLVDDTAPAPAPGSPFQLRARNTRFAPVTASPEFTKTMTGSQLPAGSSYDFEFELSASADNNPDGFTMPQATKSTVKVDKLDTAVKGAFGDIAFTIPGKYSFQVKETVGDAARVTYDTTVYTYTYTVETDGTTLTVGDPEITGGAPGAVGAAFTNTYTPPGTPPPPSPPGTVKKTGAQIAGAGALAVLLLGAGAYLATKRRRNGQEQD